MRALVWLLCAANAGAVTWFGEQQALPCRPTVACTADLAAPGSLEIEVGYLFQRLQPAQHTIPFLTKLTLAPWFQLQIGGNGPTFAASNRYFDDLVIAAKLHVKDQSRYFPSLSWSVALSLPLPDQSAGTWDLFLTAYASKDFSWLHADLNLGLDLWKLEGDTRLQAWVSLALSVALPRHLGVAVENYYFADAAPLASRDGGLLLAVTYTPRPWMVLDAGCNVGYFQSQRSVNAFAGMTLLPVGFWR